MRNIPSGMPVQRAPDEGRLPAVVEGARGPRPRRGARRADAGARRGGKRGILERRAGQAWPGAAEEMRAAHCSYSRYCNVTVARPFRSYMHRYASTVGRSAAKLALRLNFPHKVDLDPCKSFLVRYKQINRFPLLYLHAS